MPLPFLNRRGFLSGLISTICAPAIVRPELLMPVKPLWVPWGEINIHDDLRPDRRRQDLDLFERTKEFALEHLLKPDGPLVYKDVNNWHEYRFEFPMRRVTAKFLTRDSEHVRRFLAQT
jgi:hypothetical protein